MPEAVTFIELQNAVGVIVGILAIVAVAWGGIRAIREAISPLSELIKSCTATKETVEKLDGEMSDVQQTLKDYEEYFRKDKRALEKDRKELDDLKKANSLVLRGINQLIEHELTGNHTDELKKTQSDITEYLVNR